MFLSEQLKIHKNMLTLIKKYKHLCILGSFYWRYLTVHIKKSCGPKFSKYLQIHLDTDITDIKKVISQTLLTTSCLKSRMLCCWLWSFLSTSCRFLACWSSWIHLSLIWSLAAAFITHWSSTSRADLTATMVGVSYRFYTWYQICHFHIILSSSSSLFSSWLLFVCNKYSANTKKKRKAKKKQNNHRMKLS